MPTIARIPQRTVSAVNRSIDIPDTSYSRNADSLTPTGHRKRTAARCTTPRAPTRHADRQRVDGATCAIRTARRGTNEYR